MVDVILVLNLKIFHFMCYRLMQLQVLVLSYISMINKQHSVRTATVPLHSSDTFDKATARITIENLIHSLRPAFNYLLQASHLGPRKVIHSHYNALSANEAVESAQTLCPVWQCRYLQLNCDQTVSQQNLPPVMPPST